MCQATQAVSAEPAITRHPADAPDRRAAGAQPERGADRSGEAPEVQGFGYGYDGPLPVAPRAPGPTYHTYVTGGQGHEWLVQQPINVRGDPIGPAIRTLLF